MHRRIVAQAVRLASDGRIRETQVMRATGRRIAGAITAALAAAWLLAGRVLAADPPPVTSIDGPAATLLVIVLLGSLTAGLFFASPLRRRVIGATTASTEPAGTTEPAPSSAVGRLADSIYARLAAITRRWPVRATTRPLPPMLGGDIFDGDAAAPLPAVAPSPTSVTSATRATPWSTNPVSDDRYGPFR
jgi:hypothetical protein